MKRNLLTWALLLVLLPVSAQIVLEKEVDLTGKSRMRGYLGNLIVDDAKQQFDMVFVTKSTGRSVKYEVYQFDYDFNLLNNFEEEEAVSKYKSRRSKYRGVDFEVIEGVSCEPNKIGKLVLKKTETEYSFNWWRGQYEITTRTRGKEKPKEIDEDGNTKKKLIYTAHKDDPLNGKLLALGMVNPGQMKYLKEAEREFVLMEVDKDLNITTKDPITFKHPQALLYSGVVEDTDDWVLVFAPYGGQGYGSVADKDPTNLTYIKVDPNGKVKERFNFNTKANLWVIFDMVPVGDDIYLYGMGSIDSPDKKYTRQPYALTTDVFTASFDYAMRDGQIENQKYQHLQVVKISGGKAEFVSATSIADINAAGAKPDSQKKLKDFSGKQFVLNGFNVTSSGDIFISGQDFTLDAVGQVRGRVYKDMFMFHLDNTGNFKRYYGVQSTAKSAGLLGGAGGAKSFPSEFSIYEAPNGKDLYWNVFLVKDIDVDCAKSESVNLLANTKTTTTTCSYTPLFQGRYSKIDIASGKIDDFSDFGGKNFYLYIDLEDGGKGKDFPYFRINGGKQIVYVARERKGAGGTDRWGSTLWFGKLDPNN
ncbi:MAG TPA: hypothetical protein PKC24_00135 [Cyclobacteriaceae bacterium]|nr:hypothetical protein [Cyclobacteriaceae bacterium]